MKSTVKPKPKTPVKAKSKPVASKIITKKVFVHKLNVTQLDSLGLRLAAVPISNKDRELVARTLIDELGIKDTDRFYRCIREENVPTAKT